MQRRSFLKSLLALVAAPVVAKVVLKKEPSPVKIVEPDPLWGMTDGTSSCGPMWKINPEWEKATHYDPSFERAVHGTSGIWCDTSQNPAVLKIFKGGRWQKAKF